MRVTGTKPEDEEVSGLTGSTFPLETLCVNSTTHLRKWPSRRKGWVGPSGSVVALIHRYVVVFIMEHILITFALDNFIPDNINLNTKLIAKIIYFVRTRNILVSLYSKRSEYPYRQMNCTYGLSHSQYPCKDSYNEKERRNF